MHEETLIIRTVGLSNPASRFGLTGDGELGSRRAGRAPSGTDFDHVREASREMMCVSARVEPLRLPEAKKRVLLTMISRGSDSQWRCSSLYAMRLDSILNGKLSIVLYVQYVVELPVQDTRFIRPIPPRQGDLPVRFNLGALQDGGVPNTGALGPWGRRRNAPALTREGIACGCDRQGSRIQPTLLFPSGCPTNVLRPNCVKAGWDLCSRLFKSLSYW